MNPNTFEQRENPTKLSEPAETERSRAVSEFHLPFHLPLAPFDVCLIVGLLFLLPTLRANPPVLVAGDGTYLGVVSANEYDPASTSNPFGLYGSAFSATSINNPYSLYGSEFSADSANNPYVVSDPLEK
jgi:hypothetical protein